MMLKWRGSGPFKDGLTLEDYRVHDGSCLDLEGDAGGR